MWISPLRRRWTAERGVCEAQRGRGVLLRARASSSLFVFGRPRYVIIMAAQVERAALARLRRRETARCCPVWKHLGYLRRCVVVLRLISAHVPAAPPPNTHRHTHTLLSI